MKKFCINCGASLDSDSMFCPSCGAKQSASVKISTDEIVSETVVYSISLKDKFNNMISKYHLIPSDIIVMIGAFITILGIYVFNAFSTNLEFLEYPRGTFAGQIRFSKMLYNYLLNVAGKDSLDTLMAYQYIIGVVAILTIIPIVMVVSTFINKKIFKIISVIALLMTTIWYCIVKIELESDLGGNWSSTEYVLLGPAYTVIWIGLFMMLGGSCYSLYKFIQKNNHKTSSL